VAARLRSVLQNAPLSLAVAGFALLAVQIVSGFGGSGLATFDENWTYNLITALAALNCFVRARGRPDRFVWIAVGTAIAAWCAGDVYYTFWLESKAVTPFPSLADALYLLFYPPVYVALVVLFHKEVRGIVRSLWLDGIIAALTTSGVAVSIVFEVVSNSLGDQNLSMSALATNLAYPIADAVLLGIVVGAVALSGWRFSTRWIFFGGGLALFAVADSVYLIRTATDTYTYGTLLDLGWPAGMLLIAAAAIVPATVCSSCRRSSAAPRSPWRSSTISSN
jgi:diguanylate cyclase